MADAFKATLRYCPVLAAEPEGRLAAIVDFTFNLGTGRLQTDLPPLGIPFKSSKSGSRLIDFDG
jgi:hypothetical protein